ncbi:MAG: hypothetical protein QGF59_21795, partial [Pirellulaceae bacterium]|nr:hypothetical protein [Pirellulaceae bacterium]
MKTYLLRTSFVSLCGFLVAASVTICLADSIWIEGEKAQTRQVTRHGWYDGVKKDVLSGNEWLSHFDANKPGMAGYEFKAEKTGDYKFWIRANHVKSSLAYRLDSG